MHPVKSFSYTFTAVAAAILLAGCGAEAPITAPTVRPTDASRGLVTDLVRAVTQTLVSVVNRSTPLARDVIVTAQIDAKGGKIKVPETGFELTVPKGAVGTMTTFQVKALAGSILAYEFEPHGATFAVPLRFSQELKVLDLTSLLTMTTPAIGYFSSPTQLNQAAGTAAVSELQPAVIVTDLGGRRAEGNIYHFSGYLVSSGRAVTNSLTPR